MPRLFGIFEHVVLISLPESADRRQRMARRLAGLGAEYRIDPGIRPGADAAIRSMRPLGHLACAMAHLRIIREAQSQAWPSVFILEDDCLLRDDTPEQMQQMRADVTRLPWDFFYLGADVRQWTSEAAPGLWWVENVYQTHAYAVRRPAYAATIAWLNDVIAKDLPEFDSFAFPCNRLCARPLLAIQEPGVSAITKVHEDKRDKYFRAQGDERDFLANCTEFCVC